MVHAAVAPQIHVQPPADITPQSPPKDPPRHQNCLQASDWMISPSLPLLSQPSAQAEDQKDASVPNCLPRPSHWQTGWASGHSIPPMPPETAGGVRLSSPTAHSL
mmetsp:Transcript_34053/g.84201  ORF Transcript_34053/g.84201 Transcript_34053/m.84201 type:complete len:105 (+) Transcript_34053:96-410(+)